MKCAWMLCGKEFEPTHHRRKYCCELCAKAAQIYKINKRAKEKRVKVQKKCAVCPNLFYPHNGRKTCSDECRKIYYKNYAKKYEVNYRHLYRTKPKPEIKDDFDYIFKKSEAKPLDGNVLHKAEMTVDEYNRTHGTNYSYGYYVHYIESKGV